MASTPGLGFLTPSQPLLVTTPAFHLMGVLPLLSAVFFQIPFVALPDKPLSVELVMDVIRAMQPAKWDEEGQIDEQEFIDDVWPTVQQGNEAVSNYGRIAKNKIRLASRDKPFEVTLKGTTKRNAVNKDYKDEIEAIYTAAESEEPEKLPEKLDEGSMISFVRRVVCSLLNRQDIGPQDDLYGAGLDSLQTIRLAKIFTQATGYQLPDADRKAITAAHIYAHSTVSQLARFLLTLVRGDIVSVASRTERVNNMASRYTEALLSLSRTNVDLPEKSTVILTSSTGSLGTYLLHTLLYNKSVAKIYCFNRSDALSRQVKSLKDKALPADLLNDTGKVEFLTVAFGESDFGLAPEKYQELLETVEVIVCLEGQLQPPGGIVREPSHQGGLRVHQVQHCQQIPCSRLVRLVCQYYWRMERRYGPASPGAVSRRPVRGSRARLR